MLSEPRLLGALLAAAFGLACSAEPPADPSAEARRWRPALTERVDGLLIGEAAPCRPGAPPPGVFTEVAEAAGVALVHADTHPDGTPTFNAGGLAMGDLDEDGVLDLYATDGLGPDRLYLSGDGALLAWREVLVHHGISAVQSAVIGDLDNDGHQDVIVAGERYGILRGDGAGGLTPAASNLDEVLRPLGPLATLSLADVDADGWLDVAGVNGDELSDTDLITEGAPDILAAGGPGLTFTDVPLPQAEPHGVGCLPGWFDMDNDGDQDLYIVNDFGYTVHANRLLRNDGGRVFTDVSEASGAGLRVAGMGGAFGDFDNDGWEDAYVTSMLSATTVDLEDREGLNLLLHNQQDGTFVDVVKERNAYGLTLEHAVGWGAVFFDVDADGDQDLYVVRAFEPTVLDPFSAPGTLLDHPDVLLRNDGDTFSDATTLAGLDRSAVTQAPLVGDLDRDGFPDLVVSVIWGRPLVYLNGCDDRGWLAVRLRPTASNRSGVGAIVTITAGGQTQRREIRSGGVGAGGSAANEAYFGLGDAQRVERLEVRWPNGRVQRFDDVPARRYVTVVE